MKGIHVHPFKGPNSSRRVENNNFQQTCFNIDGFGHVYIRMFIVDFLLKRNVSHSSDVAQEPLVVSKAHTKINTKICCPL